MARRKSRISTLLKLSPLYLLAGFLLYVLLFMEKDFNFLAEAHDQFQSGEYDKALEHLDTALERKLYHGGDLLQVFMLRARSLNILKGHNRALEDLEKVIHLAPRSEEARKAWSLKGEIQLSLENFEEAIAIFERLSVDPEVEDDEKRSDYKSQAAAAAYQLSQSHQFEALEILRRNLEDSTLEEEAMENFIADLHSDYDLAYLETVFEENLADSTRTRIIEQAQEAKRHYRTAFDALKAYPLLPYFNPLATLFLANIQYRSDHHYSALLNCALGLREALPSGQRLGLLQLMADIYMDLGAYKRAADVMESILELITVPRLKNELKLEILLTRLEAGDYPKVIAESEKLVKSGHGDQVAQFCLGTAYLMQENLFRAIPPLKRVVDSALTGWAPRSEIQLSVRRDCFQRLHQAYVQERSYNQALKVLNDAIQIYPHDLEFRRMRADFIYETLGNPTGAQEDYHYLLENGPRAWTTFERWFLAREMMFEAANGFTFEDRARELVDQFERKEEMIGGDPRRMTELQESTLFDVARQEVAMQVALCRELIQRGRREGAKTLIEQLIRKDPDIVEFSFRLGLLHYVDGNPKQALKEFKKVLVRDPTDHESVKLAIRCCRELGDIVEEGRITRSVFREDWPVLGLWLLAQLSFDEGKFENYMRLYQTLRDAPDAVQTDMDLMAARCLIEQGEYHEAVNLVDPVLLEDPENIEAVKVRTRLLLYHPKVDEEEPEPEEVEPAEPESEVAQNTSPPPGEEPQEEITEEDPLEPFRKIDSLVAVLNSMGPRLAKSDVEELIDLFLKRSRPDLVFDLMKDIEIYFPLSPAIHRLMTEAYQVEGRYQEAADILVQNGETEEDLRWAFGLSLLTDDPVNEVRKVKGKASGMMDHGEFFLRSAACASLMSGISESNQDLTVAEQYQDSGLYSSYEAEWIDYLSRLINRLVKQGHDVSFNELPPPEEEVEPEEESIDAEEEVLPEEESAEPVEEGVPENEPTEPAEESTEPVEDGVPENEPTEPEEESAEPVEEGLEDAEEEKPSTGGRFSGEPPPKKDFPALFGRGKAEDQATPPLPPLTADTILVDKVPLKERYKEIVAEVVYIENRCQELTPENVVLIRALLRHLLLRHIDGLEEACREAAEDALAVDKGLGLVARYLLNSGNAPQSPQKTIERLARSVIAVPTDSRTLELLARAFTELGWDNLLMTCLVQLERTAPDPQGVKLLKAEFQLNRGNRSGALDLLQEVIDEAEGAAAVLERVLPLAMEARLTDSVFDLANAIMDDDAHEEETVQSILAFLDRSPADERTLELAEKLIPSCPPENRATLVGILARCYIAAKDEAKLLETAEELMVLLDEAGKKDDALYKTFFAVGAGLAKVGQNDRALEILTHQYFIRPERGDPLAPMADIAESMDKIRKCTDYRYLLNLLRPWDVKNTRELVSHWFYRTGKYKDAHDLVERSKGLSIEDPEETALITMAYSFMNGNTLQAINLGVKSYFKRGVKYPSIIYLSACLFYELNDHTSAQRLFKMMSMEFPDHPFAPRSRYYMDRILDRPAKSKGKGKGGDP